MTSSKSPGYGPVRVRAAWPCPGQHPVPEAPPAGSRRLQRRARRPEPVGGPETGQVPNCHPVAYEHMSARTWKVCGWIHPEPLHLIGFEFSITAFLRKSKNISRRSSSTQSNSFASGRVCGAACFAGCMLSEARDLLVH